jgi:hypothetical protein
MNKKMFAITMVTLSALLMISMASAAITPPTISMWTDKPQYSPGDKGTLYVVYYNDRDVAVTIKNISITYSNWMAYVGGAWVGNETRLSLSNTVASKSTLMISPDITFTVPSDGRGVDTPVSVTIGTDYGYRSDTVFISVPQTPAYLQQIVTLFTILLVLTIVCTIIIAATIFLSARRPQVMWKTEQKTE